jgi:hypothetical protein
MRALRTQASVPMGGSPPLGWHRSRGEIRRSEVGAVVEVGVAALLPLRVQGGVELVKEAIAERVLLSGTHEPVQCGAHEPRQTGMLSDPGRDHRHSLDAFRRDASRQERVALELHGAPLGGRGQHIVQLPALGEDDQVMCPRADPIDATRLAIRQQEADRDPGGRKAASRKEGLGVAASVDGQVPDLGSDQLAAEGAGVELAVLEAPIAHRLGEQIGIERLEGDAARLGAGQRGVGRMAGRSSSGRVMVESLGRRSLTKSLAPVRGKSFGSPARRLRKADTRVDPLEPASIIFLRHPFINYQAGG